MDIPLNSKDYIHRVGRTARAGKSGKSVTLVTQYDVELYQRIEHLIGKKLPLYKCEQDQVMALNERVCEAQRAAKLELKDMEEQQGRKTKFKRDINEDDDTENFNGARKRVKFNEGSSRGGRGDGNRGGRGGGGRGGRGNFKNRRNWSM